MIFIAAHHVALIIFICLTLAYFIFYLLSLLCLHVHLCIIWTSTHSGCVVSGLHSGGDDQGKCVVSRHWPYPCPHHLCSNASSLHSVWRDLKPFRLASTTSPALAIHSYVFLLFVCFCFFYCERHCACGIALPYTWMLNNLTVAVHYSSIVSVLVEFKTKKGEMLWRNGAKCIFAMRHLIADCVIY